MTITFKVIGTLLLASLPGLAFAQGTKPKENKALEQLKDVNRSSQDAASTRNEPSKAKSNQNIDTATKPAVRAGETKPTTQQQAIQRFEQSGRPTGEASGRA